MDGFDKEKKRLNNFDFLGLFCKANDNHIMHDESVERQRLVT